jgi:hypothetical protein
MPDKKDRDLWWAFLSGRPEEEWNPPKKPKIHKTRQRLQPTRAFAGDDETVLLYGVPQTDIAVQGSPAPDEQLMPQFLPREPLPSLVKCIDEVCRNVPNLQ